MNPFKKKKKNQTANPGKEKEKEKEKKERTTNANLEKKKSKGGQKLRLWVPYVCLITILSLSYELWKLKTAKSCFQFP